jgi:thymidylate synthase
MNPLSKEGFLEKLKTDREFNSRYGRKHTTEGKMVLPPCHYGFQVYTRELSDKERHKWVIDNIDWVRNSEDPEHEANKYLYRGEPKIYGDSVPTRAISLMWNQRSVDTFLGLPFNIASYGLLLEIIAKEVNMVPDELIGNLGDTHLYLNHIDQAKEQIGQDMSSEERMSWWFKNNKPNRDVTDYVDLLPESSKKVYFDESGVPKRTREPYPLPTLDIKLHFKNTPSFTPEHWLIDDFEIINYQSHSKIEAPLNN